MVNGSLSQHHGIHYYYSVAGMLLILLPARECVRCLPQDTLCAPGWLILFRQPSCVHEKEPQQAYGVSIQVGQGASIGMLYYQLYYHVLLPAVCLTLYTLRLRNAGVI